MIEIIPDNTCPPDFAELSRRSKEFAEFSPRVQLDVGDGAFVPARSWPYGEGQLSELKVLADRSEGLPYAEKILYEAHIMAQKPQEVGVLLARAKAQRIIGHIETFASANEARDALAAWRSAGAKEVGFSLLLDTPLSVVAPLVSECDVVQLMAIAKLGYQGAQFEPRIFDRIREVRAAYPDLIVEIDGGVSESTIADLVRAGATRFSVGSAISKAIDPKAAYEHLKSIAESAIQ